MKPHHLLTLGFSAAQAGTLSFDGLTAAVPEPGSYALLGLGLRVFGAARRRHITSP